MIWIVLQTYRRIYLFCCITLLSCGFSYYFIYIFFVFGFCVFYSDFILWFVLQTYKDFYLHTSLVVLLIFFCFSISCSLIMCVFVCLNNFAFALHHYQGFICFSFIITLRF